MPDAWLRCRVYKGLFSSDLAIEYQPPTGKPQSFIVPREHVQTSAAFDGQLRVEVFRQNESAFAILPTTDAAVIPIHERDLWVG